VGDAPYISGFRKRHGLLWSKEMSDPFIDLVLWQRFREPAYSAAKLPDGGPHELMLSACRTLFTKRQLSIHRWAIRMVKAYTEEEGAQYWLGAGSSGKSHMAGLCVTLDYIASFGAAEDEASSDDVGMYAMMVSTNKEALAKRSLASAVQYLGYLRGGPYGVPFKFLSQKFAILPDTVGEENIASFKARIDGVALAEGSEVEARGKVIGVHLPRIRVVADEFENLSESRANAFQVAQVNLQAGCSDYKCLYLSNPQGRQLPCSRAASPVGGWDKIELDCYEWRNAQGQLVLRFDGMDSPGIAEPKQYPFLPTKKYIDSVRDSSGGEDSPGFWAFVRAYPPPDMGNRTIITREMVDAWGMARPVEWARPPEAFASLDPAFTSDGDECVLERGWVGVERGTSRAVICFDPLPYVIPISASSGVPVLQQIGDAARAKLFEWGIPVERLAVDDSGTQNVADYLEILMGRGLYRCNYAAKPPPIPASANPSDTIDRRYRNSVTWMYYNLHEFAQYGQIKGLPAKAVDELCSRQLDKKLKGLLVVETKKAFKKRTKDGKSPDTADACAMLAAMVRHRFGLRPGSDSWSGAGLWSEDDDLRPPDGMAALAAEYNGMDAIDGAGRYI
jgi:hypothetical protein